MEEIQSRVVGYGKMLLSQFWAGLATGGPSSHQDQKSSATNFYHDGGGPQAPAPGPGESESGRSLVNWLSRLIGVDGKSLGEFLREYQVHVLYDLVFTFFKWIFFLYAGLLIPWVSIYPLLSLNSRI